MKYVLTSFLICLAVAVIFARADGNAIANRCKEDRCILSPLMISPLGAHSENVQRWERSLKKYSLLGTSWLGTLKGNGFSDQKHKNKKRDTLIYVPHHLDRNRDVTLVLWFHGLTGFRLDSHRVPTQIRNLDRLGKNYVLVAPEMPWSINTSTKRTRQGLAWNSKRSKHEDLIVFYKNLLAVLRDDFNVSTAEVYVIGHSAGGSAIRNSSRTGALDLIKPSKVVFSDAGYGTWTDQTWHGYIQKHPESKFILLVRKGDKPYLNTLRFLKRFARGVPSNIILRVFPRRTWTHRRIGDNSMYMDVVWE